MSTLALLMPFVGGSTFSLPFAAFFALELRCCCLVPDNVVEARRDGAATAGGG
jgi:hypothetical protein